MLTSTIELIVPKAENITITFDALTVDLNDGRSITVPLAWYPRLINATKSELDNWRLVGDGLGIHWEDIDEDVSIAGLLLGQPSGESQSSFRKWLLSRSCQPA
jgi:hypothetical protein